MKCNMDHFSSRDFYLISICIAAGCKLIDIKRSSSNYSEFILQEPSPICEEIIKKHWDKSLKLSTRDVVEAINQLKTRLHSGV